jgi:glucans biosynthesis protein
MHRRLLLAGLSAAPFLALSAPALAAKRSPPDFFDGVRIMAAKLARKPYVAPADDLSGDLASLGYDTYRDIRFRPEKARWADLGLPFQVQFFHRGGPAPERVALFEVVGGKAAALTYSADLFSFGPRDGAAPMTDVGFSGFRIHTPFNSPDYFDEMVVFQGASYFRALGRGQSYGLSSRALAINTGASTPEEFPAFVSMWIQRPAVGDTAITVYGLTDSPSCAGAHRFIITPGQTTTVDVVTEVTARVVIDNLGIAPMSSMFDFGGDGAVQRDDFRPAAHDSDGLAMATGQATSLWRPLTRPSRVRNSFFADKTPKGFGLLQRARGFGDYQDLGARYDLRPDCWVEPAGDWGEGAVRLLELPSKGEWEDNIAAWWRPAAPLKPLKPHAWRYRLNWGRTDPPADLAAVIGTRTGAADLPGSRRYVIDFSPPPSTAATSGSEIRQGTPPPAAPIAPKAVVTASSGTVDAINLLPNPQTGGLRLAFRLQPDDAQVIELKAVLLGPKRPWSETWVDQWTPA